MSEEQTPLELDAPLVNTWYISVYAPSMIATGEVATMGAAALGVLVVIRSYAKNDTGISSPSIETLMRVCGMSKNTLRKNMTLLEELGFIKVFKDHRKVNRYMTVDKVGLLRPDGTGQSMVSDHIPKQFHQVRNQQNDFIYKKRPIDSTVNFHIETLNINIQTGANSTQHIDQKNVTVAVDSKGGTTYENNAGFEEAVGKENYDNAMQKIGDILGKRIAKDGGFKG